MVHFESRQVLAIYYGQENKCSTGKKGNSLSRYSNNSISTTSIKKKDFQPMANVPSPILMIKKHSKCIFFKYVLFVHYDNEII